MQRNSIKKALIFVVFLACFQKSRQTTCYTCNSKSEENCKKNQRTVKCTDDERCVTWKYRRQVNDGQKSVDVTRVNKFCQHKKFPCNLKCQTLLGVAMECKTICCDKDKCNYGKIPSKRTVVKRSERQNTNSGGDVLATKDKLFHLIICAVVVSVFMR